MSNWKIKSAPQDRVEHLKGMGLSDVAATVLASREVGDASDFLNASLKDLRAPAELPGCNDAAKILWDAIQGDKRIMIAGDYDADGMCSTAIMVRVIRALGGKVRYSIPNRLEDDYGVSESMVREAKEQGADLMITVDSGITAVEPTKLAKSLGLKVVITDHHQMGDELPPADAIAHPQVGEYPFHGLCGGAVAFKVAWRTCQLASGSERVTEALRALLKDMTVLAAITTVCDVMPLVDESRCIVKTGLKFLPSCKIPGVQALYRVCGLSERSELESEDIGFAIGPRLNAAGRMGQASVAVELLTTDSDDRAGELAAHLDDLNTTRKRSEKALTEKAFSQIDCHFYDDDPAYVLAGKGWHRGLIGITAGKVAEKTGKPVVVVAFDEDGKGPGVGSARSGCNVDLHAAFEACTELLEGHGGHKAAAGLAVEMDKIDEFRAAFLSHVEEVTSEEDRIKTYTADTTVNLEDIDLAFLGSLDKLAPFGEANRRPVFGCKGLRVTRAKTMGADKSHLSFEVSAGGKSKKVVAFGKGHLKDAIAGAKTIDLMFTAMLNEFRGRRSVDLHLVDWRKSVV